MCESLLRSRVVGNLLVDGWSGSVSMPQPFSSSAPLVCLLPGYVFMLGENGALGTRMVRCLRLLGQRFVTG